jgi:hypothetical protein
MAFFLRKARTLSCSAAVTRGVRFSVLKITRRRCVTCPFAPPGLGRILLNSLTRGLRHGLRSYARFAGYGAEDSTRTLRKESARNR